MTPKRQRQVTKLNNAHPGAAKQLFEPGAQRKRPRTSRQQPEPLKYQRNITSRSLRDREELRKKKEKQLQNERERACLEEPKTAQRKATVKTPQTAQQSARDTIAQNKPAARASRARQERAQEKKTKPAQNTSGSRDRERPAKKAISTINAEAEDAAPVRSNQQVNTHFEDIIQQEHQRFKSELLKDVENIWDNVEALSTAGPNFRAIGRSVECLRKKILYKGFVPSEEITSNLSVRSVSIRASSAANTITTADRDMNQSNRVISEADRLLSPKPGGDKKITWSRLSNNLKRIVLENHCVNLDGEENMEDDGILEQANVIPDNTNYTESEWQADLQKCKFGNEQVFQCTIMIQAINRHGFLGFQKKLDYSVGLEWHTIVLPKLKIPKPNPNYDHMSLPTPQPDLCVGFRPEQFFVSSMAEKYEIPRHLVVHLFPEKCAATGDPGRVFPFFMMEVKGSASDVGGSIAAHQSLNDAAHALYNIWQFMNAAPELRQQFFDSVMVFTAGGHGKEFWIKIHRPLRLTTPGCPMAFRYRHILITQGKPYSQEVITLYLKKIMVWAMDTLLPKLRNAVDRVRQDFREQLHSPRGSPASTEGATSTSAADAAKENPGRSIDCSLSRAESVNSSQHDGNRSTSSKRKRSLTRQTPKKKQRTDGGGERAAGGASQSSNVTGATQQLNDSTISNRLRPRGMGKK